MSGDGRWSGYYDAVETQPPRPTLLQTLDSFAAEGRPPGAAIDLGCGNGRDTLALLQRGWRVLAIDSSAEAIERLRARAGSNARLTAVCQAMEDAALPPADLVNASFSLPLCRPAAFESLWRRIVAALRPGGRFAGHLYGPHDDWAADGVVVLEQAEVVRLIDGLEAERFEEEDRDGTTARGRAKHWHLFHLVLRKPDTAVAG